MKCCQNGPNAMRTTGLLVALTCLLSCSSPAQAAWQGEEKPEFDNAYTLNDGEWQIGLFRPTGVGLNDRLQLTTVLLGSVAGVFNGQLKLNILDTNLFAVSIAGGGFYDIKDTFGGAGARARLTVPLGQRVLLSAGAGYSWRSAESDEGEDGLDNLSGSGQEGVLFAGELELLLNPHNILIWNVYADYRTDAGELGPVIGGFFYAHAWDSFRLMVGLVFKSGDGFIFRDRADEEILDTPVLPMFDLWWRW